MYYWDYQSTDKIELYVTSSGNIFQIQFMFINHFYCQVNISPQNRVRSVYIFT